MFNLIRRRPNRNANEQSTMKIMISIRRKAVNPKRFLL